MDHAAVRLSRFISRHLPDADQLAARSAVADRVVAQRVAALARARERYLAAPDSADAVARLDAAEELLFIAEYEQRAARAALVRARKRGRFARSGGDAARTEPSS